MYLKRERKRLYIEVSAAPADSNALLHLPRIRGLVGTRTSRAKRLPSSRHPNFDVGYFGSIKETNFWLRGG